MPADTDYVIFFIVALLAVVGAGLLRVGLDEIARAAIHRSRYCLRYCSSADFSAEGSEDRRLSLRVRSGRSIPSKYRNEFARGFVIVRSSRFRTASRSAVLPNILWGPEKMRGFALAKW